LLAVAVRHQRSPVAEALEATGATFQAKTRAEDHQLNLPSRALWERPTRSRWALVGPVRQVKRLQMPDQAATQSSQQSPQLAAATQARPSTMVQMVVLAAALEVSLRRNHSRVLAPLVRATTAAQTLGWAVTITVQAEAAAALAARDKTARQTFLETVVPEFRHP
jgi:hypothetical protein